MERLKGQLRREGLLDASRKQTLPPFPRKIAIITARTGAVLHDIRTVSAARNPLIPLVLLPVKVQGVGAAEEIAQALDRVLTLPDIDVVIVGRGGGSLEDLWAFNEEVVARAIAACPIPVISAVGHETDFTIADMVADVRAATPSNAAELAVPDKQEIFLALDSLEQQVFHMAREEVKNAKLWLMQLENRLQRQEPAERIQSLTARMQNLL